MASKKREQHSKPAAFIAPMLLKLVDKLPEGDQWQYEVKWDGYRGVSIINGGKVQLISRNEKDLSKRFPVIVDVLKKLPMKNAALDGEIVVLDEEGKPSFQDLQYFEPKLAVRLFYYAFDLLHLNGEDLRHRKLAERRELLEQLLSAPPAHIRFSSTLEGTPEQLIPIIREQGLEGIVAKKKDSVYEPGKRSGAWQKFKLNRDEEFWICGSIPGGKHGIESVVLGVKEKGSFRYVATLDVKLPAQSGRKIEQKLSDISTAECPFTEIPEREPGNSWSGGMTQEEKDAAIWVKPKYKAEVTFLEWTRGGFLRHAQVKQLFV
jgi:bifunctional non-homologous end joining protein LigD